jgi:NAD(P)-dependent dehydrogenase (short-subunit alcohol dehydrogenase family)
MTQTILITGAAKRIGRAMAVHFATKGWRVAAHYSASEKEALELQAQFKNIRLFQADLSQPNAAAQLFEDVQKTCGIPDVLINNACRFERDEGAITDSAFHSHLTANALAPIELAQKMNAVSSGAVFNILDQTLDMSWPNLSSYVLSKITLEEWTRRSAQLLKPNLYIFGLRLGPTLLNPRQSKAHFAEAISKTKNKAQTNVPDILATIDLCLQNPDPQPTFFDV